MTRPATIPTFGRSEALSTMGNLKGETLDEAFRALVSGFAERLRSAGDEDAPALLGELADLVADEAGRSTGVVSEHLSKGAAELRSIRWHYFGVR